MKAKEKIIFIDNIRGIATFFVLLSHLGFVFWYSNALVANLLHIEERENIASTVPRIYGDITAAIMDAQLNLGMIGVACFFLISGFIIPHSVGGGG